MWTSRRFARLLTLMLRHKVFELDGQIVEIVSVHENGLCTVHDMRKPPDVVMHDIEPRRLK